MDIFIKPKIFFFTLCFMFILSCKEKRENYFKPPVNSKKILINQLRLDSIILEAETSFTGFFKIRNDKMYFADSRFCWVYEFDPNGKLLKRHLGHGGGPKELKTNKIDFFRAYGRGRLLYYGTN